MNSKFLLATAAVILITLTGCAGRGLTNQQIGTATGAVVGGVVGSAVLGGPIGTLGGAAGGALIGNELGKR
jgi:osmotically inducible lipoprotein OsmB